MKNIVRTPAARQDLVGIWTYIAGDNPSAADRFLEAIEARIRLIATHPRIGRARDEFSTGLRSFVIGRYIIFYRDVPDAVRVIRVLHGARNLAKILKREPR